MQEASTRSSREKRMGMGMGVAVPSRQSTLGKRRRRNLVLSLLLLHPLLLVDSKKGKIVVVEDLKYLPIVVGH
jgi:hypothetical protein